MSKDENIKKKVELEIISDDKELILHEEIEDIKERIEVETDELEKDIEEIETKLVSLEVSLTDKIENIALKEPKLPPDGEKGDKGDKGNTGEKGDKGDKGLDGKDGKDGLDGKDGIDGIDGKDGTDADLTGEVVIERINTDKTSFILKEKVEGLSDLERITKENAHKLYTGVSETRVNELIAKIPSSGDVNGPASSTDNNIAVFDGTTGKLIKDGGATIASKQDALSGATLTGATVAGTDKVLIQDVDDSDNLKTVTAQSIADLASVSPGGSDTQLQYNNAGAFGGASNVIYDNATGDLKIKGDGDKLYFGAGDDFYIEYDGADTIFQTVNAGESLIFKRLSTTIMEYASGDVLEIKGASRSSGQIQLGKTGAAGNITFIRGVGGSVNSVGHTNDTNNDFNLLSTASGSTEIFIKRLGTNILAFRSDDDMEVIGNVEILTDSKKLSFGAGRDASIKYDGTNMVITSDEVGTGSLIINGGATINAAGDYTTQQTGAGTVNENFGASSSVDTALDGQLAIGNSASTAGTNSTAIGRLSTAGSAGQSSATAIGAGSSATKDNSVAIGANSTANFANAIAIGGAVTAGADSTVVIGSGANSAQSGGTAVGNNATASGASGTAIGQGATALASNTSALGVSAYASGSNATAIGRSAVGSNVGSTALGQGATASGYGSIAIGYSSVANTSDSITIGQNAAVGGNYSMAFGTNANASAANTFVAGSAGRGITDVYFSEGITDTTPLNWTLHGTGGSGTDIAGGDITIAGGKGTGAGVGGDIIFQTTSAGASATTLRTLTTRVTIDGETGNTTFTGRIMGAKGSDVASATDITLGNGNYFDITGTTQIDSIIATNWTAGSVVILQFDASVTVKHNTAGTGASLLLAGAVDFSATANDTLQLVYDGTTWREVSRTVI